MDTSTTLTNIYQLIGFVVITGLQVYTRYAVSKVAKNQEVMLAKHDASRAEMLRLAEHAYARIAMKKNVCVDDAVATVEAALRVAYYQGQSDVSTENPFPQERVTAAAKTLVQLCMQAAQNGHNGDKPETPPAKP
jgi:hypothetical protein